MPLDADTLRRLLVDVKPSLEGRAIGPGDSLTLDLGLDSLDLLQLGRRIQRAARVPFVTEEWAIEERQRQGQAKFTVASLLAAVAALERP